jgi:hypothetical protein
MTGILWTPYWNSETSARSDSLFLKIHFNIFFPSHLCSSGFATEIMYALGLLISPTRATCPVHLNLFDLIILILVEHNF